MVVNGRRNSCGKKSVENSYGSMEESNVRINQESRKFHAQDN